MAVAKVIAAIVIALISQPIWWTIKNYREAKKLGLPIFLLPFSPMDQITFLLGPLLFPFMSVLPRPICDWAKYGEMFWMYPDRYEAVERFGPAFLIVNPGKTILILADPVAGDDMLSKTKQFLKPRAFYEAIEMFGPNVDTVNGEAWNRHRRITTPPFNERNSSLVWSESQRQAGPMLESWVKRGKEGVSLTPNDTMKLALHVLMGAGFGQSYDYDSGLTELPEGHEMSYAAALAYVLSDIGLSIMTVKLPFSLGFIPKFRKMEKVLDEFRRYMTETVDEERRLTAKRGTKDNLMSVLLRAADTSKAGGNARDSLTDEEIYGNLFIWNFAGHDTTAGVLAYAVTLLAVNPHVQDWISEEINDVFGDTPVEQWEYEKAFPRLKRCLALMYETLRLYGPVLSMVKYTDESSQTLRLKDRDIRIPPHYYVVLNFVALHCTPEIWGDDALVWNPQRFIRWPADNSNTEELLTPKTGSFSPWASGPRVCPGKKFAQVEFVSVIAYLLRKHRVRPVILDGENEKDMRTRVMSIVDDSKVNKGNPTLKMMHPEKVRLIWEKAEDIGVSK